MRIVIFCYFLFATSDVASELVNPLPQNKASLRGTTNVAFYCSSDNGWGFISWTLLPVGGSTSQSITTGSNVAPAYSDIYSVSNEGDRTSTLTIKTVNESLAGTYTCNEAAPTASAQLIVYNSDPVCTSNVSSGQNLTPGQSVQMSCSFSYTATSSSVGVNMVWSQRSSSTPVQSPSPAFTTTGTLTTAVSTITQTVGNSSPFPVYRCQTSFTVTGTTTNDPGYLNTAQPNSSPINATSNAASTTRSSTTVSSPRSTLLQPATPSSSSSSSSSSDGRQSSANTASPTKSTATILSRHSTVSPPVTSSSGERQSSAIIISNSTVSSTESRSGSDTKIAVGVAVGIGLPILLIVLILVICFYVRKKRAGGGQMPGFPPVSELGQVNAATYQELADRSAHQGYVNTQLAPSGVENPALDDDTYETLTNGTYRTHDYEHEYDQIHFPLENRKPCYHSTRASEYCNLDQ